MDVRSVMWWLVHFSSGDSNSGSPPLVQICMSVASSLLFISGKNAKLMVVSVLKNSVLENLLYQIVLLYSL